MRIAILSSITLIATSVLPTVVLGAGPLAIQGAKIITVAGDPIPSGTILVRDGKIEAIGADVDVPAGETPHQSFHEG